MNKMRILIGIAVWNVDIDSDTSLNRPLVDLDARAWRKDKQCGGVLFALVKNTA